MDFFWEFIAFSASDLSFIICILNRKDLNILYYTIHCNNLSLKWNVQFSYEDWLLLRMLSIHQAEQFFRALQQWWGLHAGHTSTRGDTAVTLQLMITTAGWLGTVHCRGEEKSSYNDSPSEWSFIFSWNCGAHQETSFVRSTTQFMYLDCQVTPDSCLPATFPHSPRPGGHIGKILLIQKYWTLHDAVKDKWFSKRFSVIINVWSKILIIRGCTNLAYCSILLPWFVISVLKHRNIRSDDS